MNTTTIRSATVPSAAAADRWLSNWERRGWSIVSAGMSETDGNKIKVSATLIPPGAVPAQPVASTDDTGTVSVAPGAVTETEAVAAVCKGPGCNNPLPVRGGRGRVKAFCSAKCRQAAHRHQQRVVPATTTNLRADVVATLRTLADRLSTVKDDEVNELDPATLPQILKHATALAGLLPAKAHPASASMVMPAAAAPAELPALFAAPPLVAKSRRKGS